MDGYQKKHTGQRCADKIGEDLSSLEDAKKQCTEDESCIAIQDVGCAENVYFKCSGGLTNSSSSCIFEKV